MIAEAGLAALWLAASMALLQMLQTDAWLTIYCVLPLVGAERFAATPVAEQAQASDDVRSMLDFIEHTERHLLR